MIDVLGVLYFSLSVELFSSAWRSSFISETFRLESLQVAFSVLYSVLSLRDTNSIRVGSPSPVLLICHPPHSPSISLSFVLPPHCPLPFRSCGPGEGGRGGADTPASSFLTLSFPTHKTSESELLLAL